LQGVEQPGAENHHGGEDRDLEAAEEGEDAPASPTRIPSWSTLCRFTVISSERFAPGQFVAGLPFATVRSA
jgi:hypothetical protein